ncbi:DUF4190 domain-containing protein [Bifidobacterium boum]|uniref:DUF4190 domain-containing protein n=1 Tax=Bifidobacterium boum TaxID=78343 RepID=UPI003F8EBDEE
MTNGQIPWDAPAEGQPADQFQPTQPAQTQTFTAATQPDQSQPTVSPLPTPDVPAQPDWAQPAYAQQPQQLAYVQQPPQPQFQADAAQPVYPQPDAGYAQQSYYAQPDPAGVTPGYGMPYGAAGMPTAQQANYMPYVVKPKMNTLAVVGFICSFLVSLIGLILCIIAKNQIKTSGERGNGLATAGIIISAIMMALSLICQLVMFSSPSHSYSTTVLLPMLFGLVG